MTRTPLQRLRRPRTFRNYRRVPDGGIEPPASNVSGWRSDQLSQSGIDQFCLRAACAHEIALVDTALISTRTTHTFPFSTLAATMRHAVFAQGFSLVMQPAE